MLLNRENFLDYYNTVFVVAPGPSLSNEQVNLLSEVCYGAIIAIGEAGRVALPNCADVLYHADKKWWNHYKGCPEFKGIKVSCDPVDFDDVLQVKRSNHKVGLDLDFPNVVLGYNSGYQAINLAIHMRPKRLILVGFDMQDLPDGTHNIIGDHPKEVKRPSNFKLFREAIDSLKPYLDELGIKTYNCSINSALTAFDKEELRNVI